VKRSTQWDIVGVIALIIALTAFVSDFTNEGLFNIGGTLMLFGNPFVIGFAVLFSFMCFIFGFFEGNREKQQGPIP
jgi:hypothetical protein